MMFLYFCFCLYRKWKINVVSMIIIEAMNNEKGIHQSVKMGLKIAKRPGYRWNRSTRPDDQVKVDIYIYIAAGRVVEKDR